MSEPEIARRCPSCGASIRVRASFCPQCGNPLAKRKGDSKQSATDAKPDILTENDVSLAETQLEILATDLAQQSSKGAEASHAPATDDSPHSLTQTQPDTPAREETNEVNTVAGMPDVIAPARPTQPAPPLPRNRKKAVSRNGVREDVLHRVENWRQMSTVVIDEASYDPSLRFVLVAAVLFIVFLVILVLSELIT